ncbi:MAG: type IV pili methyl-accepting chemotaxis transducer N-terminal domain-containing protein [Betaproteobacteria bacterium]|nr:type IV pili methyl-accepting chemotaxis transducer N-terminal domain-containing protein [Betaproteobacteria bacterium]
MELPKMNLFSRKADKPAPDPVPAEAVAEFDRTMMIMKQGLGKEPRGRKVKLGVGRQLAVWGFLWAVFGVLSFMPLVYYIVNQVSLKEQLHVSADLQMLSQRLGRYTQQASAGNPLALKQLRQADELITASITALIQGNQEIKASPEAIQNVLATLDQQWQPLRKNVSQVLALEKTLTGLERSSKAVNDKEAEMLALSQEIAGAISPSGAGAREALAAGQLVAHSTRIPQAARHLLSRNNPGDWANDLAFASGSFRDALRVLQAGARDGALRERVERLAAIYAGIAPDIGNLLDNVKTAVSAKQAAQPLVTASDKALADTTAALTEAYSKETSSGLIEGVITFWLAAFTAFFAVMFARVMVGDAKDRAKKSEEQNQQNQEAILRLLDEMGGLADGDLTTNATVTEDVTGAIADSINFTIAELRTLVQRINKTTEAVADAAQRAQKISVQLLQGALKQSKEIQETSASVTDMAKSIEQVSQSAEDSARVAQQSLDAAHKGQAAVQNAIAGMNEIRQQIQETAKRIKRLGESSQEIHEIVDLIADLTEQTNVLALNAAIQAASAGEAGRGFSVVAEEVQRLAERAAQATKQIGGIVNTIQTDTQNAVAAMEESTQGVVEGAKLSDAAGQALNEIDRVSKDLAEHIATISRATRSQSESAGRVVKNMQEILGITEQTTQGTKQSTDSIGQLARLASELRGSVTKFKV